MQVLFTFTDSITQTLISGLLGIQQQEGKAEADDGDGVGERMIERRVNE